MASMSEINLEVLMLGFRMAKMSMLSSGAALVLRSARPLDLPKKKAWTMDAGLGTALVSEKG